jgi:hypothetical protein
VAIPDVAVNVIISAWRQPKKCNMPRGSQDKPNDDNAAGKLWRGEKLTDCQKVRDTRKSQRGHELRSASIAEVA